ncbi:MAG: hypothetical protein ACI31S_01185 [Bacilli bacterium]
MKKTDNFRIKKYEDKESRITVEEERKQHSSFALFFKNNGKLIFIITFLLSFSITLIAAYLTITNLKDSEIVYYESDGVIVTFDETDESILNGLPITKEYAGKLFDSSLSEEDKLEGVVIKIKESTFSNGKIIFYSDKTALIKYNDNTFMRIFPVEKEYGVSEKGVINNTAITKKVTGKYDYNNNLGIEILYLSDGTAEINKGKVTIFIRNTDFTNNENTFYTNLSIISIPVTEENNKVYYSNGITKEGTNIIVDNKVIRIKEEKNIHNNIKIIYYENGYAEIIKDNLSIIVEKKDHIIYDNDILEIIDNNKTNENLNTKDVMDIKNITLKNTNTTKANYIIALEETNNYQKYNIDNILDSKYINFNIYVNKKTISNNILGENLKEKDSLGSINVKGNTYVLYQGELNPNEEVSVKVGMWIDYETITNEYMNSAFIGTMRVYVESLD